MRSFAFLLCLLALYLLVPGFCSYHARYGAHDDGTLGLRIALAIVCGGSGLTLLWLGRSGAATNASNGSAPAPSPPKTLGEWMRAQQGKDGLTVPPPPAPEQVRAERARKAEAAPAASSEAEWPESVVPYKRAPTGSESLGALLRFCGAVAIFMGTCMLPAFLVSSRGGHDGSAQTSALLLTMVLLPVSGLIGALLGWLFMWITRPEKDRD